MTRFVSLGKKTFQKGSTHKKVCKKVCFPSQLNPSNKWSTCKGKNLLLKEQILSLTSRFQWGGAKIRIAELHPFNMYPYTLRIFKQKGDKYCQSE